MLTSGAIGYEYKDSLGRGDTGGPEERRLRVAVVEDEPSYQEFVRSALIAGGDTEVIASFSDAETALEKLPPIAPDVVTVDIELAGPMNGIQLGLTLRREMPTVGIVLLTHHVDPTFLSPLHQKKFSGWSYLLKKSVSDSDALRRAVAGAAQGLVVLDSQLVDELASRQAVGQFTGLTMRQRDILALMAQGFTNSAIASKLGISVKSVENQINVIYQELGIDRSDRSIQPRVTAVLMYLQNHVM